MTNPMPTSPPSHDDRRPRLLLVDDEPTNLHVLRQILGDDYRLQFATDGAKALQLAAQQKPDLILLDIMMPELSGYDVCRQLKANPQTQHIPVIFVSALSEVGDEAQGFDAGGVDYITKPVRPPIVRARVKTHLSLVSATELRNTRLQIIRTLGRAAEYRDNETGMHIMRMTHYATSIAKALGLSAEERELLSICAPMHDVGKIGIADSILLKPGRLTSDEYEVMKRHTEIGETLLDGNDALITAARDIAAYHHERWDGTGYPRGLRGDVVPIEARIVTVADIFDALTALRPYKQVWSPAQALEELDRMVAAGKLDPDCVQALHQHFEQVLAVRARYTDAEVEV